MSVVINDFEMVPTTQRAPEDKAGEGTPGANPPPWFRDEIARAERQLAERAARLEAH